MTVFSILFSMAVVDDYNCGVAAKYLEHSQRRLVPTIAGFFSGQQVRGIHAR